MGIKFEKDPLVVELNNCLTKIVNVYIVFDSAAWPRNSINNFKFKSCLFGETSMVKNSHKEKHAYSGYKITFNSRDWWSFGKDSARNVIVFGVDKVHHHMLTITKINF